MTTLHLAGVGPSSNIIGVPRLLTGCAVPASPITTQSLAQPRSARDGLLFAPYKLPGYVRTRRNEAKGI